MAQANTNTFTAGATLSRPDKSAKKALNFSKQAWFVTAVLGQWIFALYTAIYYGSSTIAGDFEAWNKVLPKGYVPGEHFSNWVVGTHMLMAAIILVGGPLQFVGKIRTKFPRFHHWNGRLYIFGAFLLALGGLHLIWIRGGGVGSTLMHLGTSSNAIVMMICAFFAVFYAIKRKIAVHQKWALRLFLSMGGVWFFRISLMLWLLIHQKPVGFDPSTFQGPFLVFLAFAQYLVPLAVLELYFYVKERCANIGHYLMTGLLATFTLMTAGGIFAATLMMWLPRL